MIPSLAMAEGGFPMVLMSVLFYLFREKRLIQVIILALFSVVSLLTGGGVQWIMVFAAIGMLLYSGARGGGSKYFFYVFYPAHIYLLYALEWLLFVR
jgi:hypothetical protein